MEKMSYENLKRINLLFVQQGGLHIIKNENNVILYFFDNQGNEVDSTVLTWKEFEQIKQNKYINFRFTV
ncbi:hypothetical protein GLW08_12725 [Pontibacillus yanchengensis]|uniref:Uncharacterized protein n=1 Tax=Pontibacillus yanchengensis TaxID=462910 RepID=A0ACC7VGZ2_9BACI|nr:hypothetical protein [Pontibacillus yanchengensis]MYL54201.1 hypothetical protein [Pontibacillus yanchengensis]